MMVMMMMMMMMMMIIIIIIIIIIIACMIKFIVYRIVFFMVNFSLLDVEYTLQSLYLG